jgi:mannan endo-1,4-beta-mannosidase
MWVHVDGKNTPAFDGNGYVTGPDSTGTMISDLKSFLDFAQSKQLLVVLVLWNGAKRPTDNTLNLLYDESKLQIYIDNALKVYLLSIIIYSYLRIYINIKYYYDITLYYY